MNSLFRRMAALLLPPAIVFAGVIIAWHFATVLFDIPAFVVPPPGSVLQAALKNGEKIGRATALTGAAALCGLLLSFVVGAVVSFAFSQSKLIQRALYPYAIFLQTVPIVAIAPVIVIWVGQDFRSVVLVAFIVSLFPVITNTTHGLTAVDATLVELFKVINATRLQMLLRLRVPNAVPHMITGLKTSAGLSVIGAIVGEFFAGYSPSSQGLGYLIQFWSGQSRSAELYAAIFASTLLGLIIFGTFSALGGLVLRRWQTEDS